MRTFTYSKRLKYGQRGQINYFKYQGKKVKAHLSQSGKKLDILDAPPSIVPKIQHMHDACMKKGSSF